MTSRESHQHCNAFSLVMICDGTNDGQLFDCKGETFSSINELTDKIVNIQTLNKKPKLILIKRCNGNNITYYKLFLIAGISLIVHTISLITTIIY